MLNKKVSISSDLQVVFHARNKPFFQNEKRIFFGFPFNLTEDLIDASIETLVDQLKGYWLLIELNENQVSVVSDMLGGVRLYYTQTESEVIFSDDFFSLEEHLHQKSLNEIELEYWQKHGFTTGRGTFLHEIRKVSPSSILQLSKIGITEHSYFKSIKRTADSYEHMNKVHSDFEDSFSSLKSLNKKVILLFSGGKDSCLLLQYLIHRNIDFEIVFFKTDPMNKSIAEDLLRARNVSSKLGLSLHEISIKLSEISNEEKEACVRQQILDKHYSLLHFFGMKSLKEGFGDDIIVINGQSSDSILSFGPSESSLMSYFRRKMLYFPSSWISKLGLLLLSVKSKKRFRLPSSNDEQLIALFDEFKYSRVLELQKSEKYFSYIKSYIHEKTRGLSSFHSKEMYAKILSFCQGSDNQVVVNSANDSGVKVIMPFATPNIIYATIENKDEHLEINHPKYVIDNILQKIFKFNYLDLISKSTKEDKVKTEVSDSSHQEMNQLFLGYISKRYRKNDLSED